MATHKRTSAEFETAGSPPSPGPGSSAGVGRLAVRTYEEVAFELGVTRQAVQQTEQRALRKVRRLLEAEGFKSSLSF